MKSENPVLPCFPATPGVRAWLSLVLLALLCCQRLPAQSADIPARDTILNRYASLPQDSNTLKSLLLQAMPLCYSDPESALLLAQRGRDMALAQRHMSLYCRSLNILGVAYWQMGALDIAHEQFEQALDSAKFYQIKNSIGGGYNNIATLYMEQKEYARAREMFRQSYEVLQAIGSPDRKWGLMNTCVAWLEEDSLDLAEKGFRRILNEEKELYAQDKRYFSMVLNNLSSIYYERGQWAEAVKSYSEALRLKQEIGDLVGVTQVRAGRAGAAGKLGLYAEAYADLDSAEVLAHSMNIPKNMSLIWKTRAEILEMQNRYADALIWYRKYNTLSDSLHIEEQTQKLNLLQTAYEVREKNEQIEELTAVQEDLQTSLNRQSAYLWALVAVAVVASGLALALYLIGRARTRAHRQLLQSSERIQQQQAEILSRNGELEALNRSMDGLLHVVAHDLKAPLNRLSGLASLLQHAGELNAEQHRYLELFSRVNQDAGKLVATLVDLHALENGQMRFDSETIALRPMVQDTVQSFQQEAARKQIQLTCTLPETDATVFTDHSALQRVLDNLISNALKFSPPGTTTTVSLELQPGTALLHVQDQGPGIRPEDHERLFRKFQRLSAQPTGGESSSGLGLAITAALIKHMEGSISFQSTPGQGTRFTVRLPLSPQ